MVLGSITNIHMKNSVGVKIVKTIEPLRNNTSRQQHFNIKISPSAHPHLYGENKRQNKTEKLKETETKQNYK